MLSSNSRDEVFVFDCAYFLQVFESRIQRLAEIEKMLNSLEELFNFHTASADEVKPSGVTTESAPEEKEKEKEVTVEELANALSGV